MVIALIVWLVMTLVAWFQGDQVMLSISGAKKVEKKDLPVLFNVVEEMTLAAGLSKMPQIYVIDDPAPNAFATGRRPETAAVAVTSGLLKILNRDELQGVIAHEIAHIRNRDIQLMLFAGVLAGAIVILAEVGLRGMWFGGGRSRSRRSDGGDGSGIFAIVAIVLMILAPILAQLIYFAVSRKREYLADASAATFTRYPEGLASALEKISRAPDKLGGVTSATAPMYIINPLKRANKMAANATSTHPPIDERVRILRSMGGQGFAAYDESYRQVHGGKGVIPGSALKEDGAAGRAARRPPREGLGLAARDRPAGRRFLLPRQAVSAHRVFLRNGAEDPARLQGAGGQVPAVRDPPQDRLAVGHPYRGDEGAGLVQGLAVLGGRVRVGRVTGSHPPRRSSGLPRETAPAGSRSTRDDCSPTRATGDGAPPSPGRHRSRPSPPGRPAANPGRRPASGNASPRAVRADR